MKTKTLIFDVIKAFIKDFWVLILIALVISGFAVFLVYTNFIGTTKYKTQWFNLYADTIIPSENIKCNIVAYDTDLSTVSYQSITMDDNYTINPDVMKVKALANEDIIVDKDNQSSFFTWGNSQFGTILKNGQLYGLISYEDADITKAFLVDNSDTIIDKYTLNLSLDNISYAKYLDTIKIDGKTIDIVHVEANKTENYVYIDRKSKRCLQYFEISDNMVSVHTFSDYNGDITFFDGMETYPIYISKADYFDETYSQFVYSAALLATNNITVDMEKIEKQIEENYEELPSDE